MKQVRELENKLHGWYKGAPHLPKEAQHWLADNVWWLALIGAILSALGLFIVIPLLLAALALTTAVAPFAAGYGYYPDVIGLGWLATTLSLISYVATGILLAMSVSPLKVKAKKGWELVFLSYLVNFGLSILGAVVTFSIVGVFGAFIGAAIGGYFLFEIYSYFGAKAKAEPKVAAKAKKA